MKPKRTTNKKKKITKMKKHEQVKETRKGNKERDK